MELTNDVLRDLLAAEVPPMIYPTEITYDLYSKGLDYLLGRYYLKHTFPNPLKIYYPISRQDEFEPSPVVYQGGGGISTEMLMKSIWQLYQTPLSQANINEYLQVDPPTYQFLSTLPNPKLQDVLLDRQLISHLEPYKDGWLLVLKASASLREMQIRSFYRPS